MNGDKQKRSIARFLKGTGKKNVDTFCIYQWIERCHNEGWWDLGCALGAYIPPNSLAQDYHKRLEFLLRECRSKQKEQFIEIKKPGSGSSDCWAERIGTNKPNHDEADIASDRDFEQLYEDIHGCRKCLDVFPSIVPRRLDPVACRSGIVLMAKAPNEDGVRKSGVHWVGADGRLRGPGGTFLDTYLRKLGYSVDPGVVGCARPYTTNVLHCWTGSEKKDRKPTQAELHNCMPWWRRELELVMPQVIILLGQPAAESFDFICGAHRSFKDLLSSQGERMEFSGLAIKRYVVPQPTAPYPGRSTIYQEVIDSVRLALKEEEPVG